MPATLLADWPIFLQSFYPVREPITHYDWDAIWEVTKVALWFFLFLYMLVRLRKDPDPIGHWSHHFADLQLSAMDFYKKIQDDVTAMQETKIKTYLVRFAERGIVSSRKYLRVTYDGLIFDICAAPFGKGFFISWWQSERNWFKKFLGSIPFVGRYLARAAFPWTYYRADTCEMFEAVVHSILLAAVDELVKEKGIRGLTELERKPIPLLTGKRQARVVAV